MIGKLKGIVDEIFEDSALLDVQGVGYIVYCTHSTTSSLKQNSPTALYIQMVVREDNIILFGFKAAEEKEWFNLLQTVQGVGAKMALSILSSFSISKIQTAIAAQDQSAFKSITGIGPKLASRIINELKNKKEIFGPLSPNCSISNHAVNTNSEVVTDAISALTNLGFNRSDAFVVASKVKETNDNIDLSELIRQSLTKLTS